MRKVYVWLPSFKTDESLYLGNKWVAYFVLIKTQISALIFQKSALFNT